ncbi:MAG: site-2 protease family protein [Bdellovibrionota bacterium]
MSLNKFLFDAIVFAPPLLTAVILHEIAHGWAAEKLGDPTARDQHRITLNPLVHIDPFMTIILPVTLILAGSPFVFGGAKPVPVNPLNFRNPRRGMAYVAIAGPIMNFLLVAICLAIHQGLISSGLAQAHRGVVVNLLLIWMRHSVLINLVLGLFNLLPVPPLDGGRIAVGFLPLSFARFWARLEPYGLWIVILLMMSGVVRTILEPVLEFVAEHVLHVPVGP